MSQARATGKNGVSPHTFYVACLLFSANIAVFLKIDRATFLAHAEASWRRISEENSRRKKGTVDPGPG